MFSLISFFMVLVITLQSLFASILFPRSSTPVAHAQVVPQALIAGNFTSPSVVGTSMWVSGSTDSTGTTPSIIFKSTFDTESGTWLAPSPAFSLPGFRVSDPSVIQNGTDLLMYYTKLAADVVGTSTALQNTIGLAVFDTQGSPVWNDVGTIIPQGNGIDSRGGWAPSAVLGSDGIWVYFTTNGPGTVEVYRARMDFTGQRLLGTDRVYFGDGTATPLSLFNVDVTFQNEQYVMLANSSLTSIVRYVSSDGVHWVTPANQVNPIVTSSAPSIIGGPNQAQNANGSPTIYFAGGSLSAGWNSINSLDQSDFTTPASFTSSTVSATQAGGTGQTASSTSSSSVTALLAVGLIGIAAIVAYALFSSAATVAAPVAATAVSQVTGFSFGGRVVAILPCISALGPSIWVTLLPASPLLPPYMYIWTPATLLSIVPPSPSIPPSHIGQEVLGRFDIPYVCFTPSTPPIPLYGLRMQSVGVSPI